MTIIRGSKIDYVPASHENPNDPGVLKKVLAKRNDLIKGRMQMINWAYLPVGKEFEPHYHEDMQEVFIILSGKVRIHVDDDSDELRKGDAVIIPVRAIHQMKNISDEAVEYIALGISTESGGQTINV
jgi:mannose-6-phosphate isomerase-like protein (cupin superfamily)